MDKIKYVDNIILQKDIFKLYKNLISSHVWNLARSSNAGEEFGCFPGFIVKDIAVQGSDQATLIFGKWAYTDTARDADTVRAATNVTRSK